MKTNLLTIKRSTQFKRDLKKTIKQGKKLAVLEEVVIKLQRREGLPGKYRDHNLGGNWNGYRECHLEPDWLLIYKLNEAELYLYLTRIGSHSELFK